MAEEPELDEFESLVADPIDRLPDEFQKVLEGATDCGLGSGRRRARVRPAHHRGWDERGVGPISSPSSQSPPSSALPYELPLRQSADPKAAHSAL